MKKPTKETIAKIEQLIDAAFEGMVQVEDDLPSKSVRPKENAGRNRKRLKGLQRSFILSEIFTRKF